MYNHVPTVFDHEPTAQEIFDAVVKHLAKQKRKCAIPTSETGSKTDTCKYRHNGYACAIGHLIPDEVYDPKMEGFTLSGLVDENFSGLPSYFSKYRNFLQYLQQAHDFCRGLSSIKEELGYVAKQFELDPSVIDAISEFSIDALQ